MDLSKKTVIYILVVEDFCNVLCRCLGVPASGVIGANTYGIRGLNCQYEYRINIAASSLLLDHEVKVHKHQIEITY